MTHEMSAMPDDFCPAIMDEGDALTWLPPPSIGLKGFTIKKSGDATVDAARRERLKLTAWQAMELARVGHPDIQPFTSSEGSARN